MNMNIQAGLPPARMCVALRRFLLGKLRVSFLNRFLYPVGLFSSDALSVHAFAHALPDREKASGGCRVFDGKQHGLGSCSPGLWPLVSKRLGLEGEAG